MSKEPGGVSLSLSIGYSENETPLDLLAFLISLLAAVFLIRLVPLWRGVFFLLIFEAAKHVRFFSVFPGH